MDAQPRPELALSEVEGPAEGPVLSAAEGPNPQPAPVPADLRSRRIASAAAGRRAAQLRHARYFLNHHYPPHQIARLTGLPIEDVLAQAPP